MNFGKWLNSLTWIDHLVIFFLFVISSYFAYVSMKGLRTFIEKTRNNPYANEFRASPFMFFAFAIPYTIFLYRLFGGVISNWLKDII